MYIYRYSSVICKPFQLAPPVLTKSSRFEALQRLNIVHLEIELTQIKSKMLGHQIGSAEDFDGLRIKLNQYGS